MMKKTFAPAFPLIFLLSVAGLAAARAADTAAPALPPPATETKPEPKIYRLSPNDVVQVKVYQEDDLLTNLRVARDGTATFPLLGVITLGGKTVEEAAAVIREALARDYLVNPQVTLTVMEYAKRRFTVLGQVQKPGAYEIPNEETVTFPQAVAMAGGYTRLASTSKITVTRNTGGKKTLVLDLKSAMNDANTKPFEILPDDTITVPERVF